MSDDVYAIVIAQAEAAKRGALSMWTVYERPRDYACGFVARRFEITRDGPKPTQMTLKCLELEPIREKLANAGMVRLDRNPEDEPQIVETWV
jgi:hypothetical protein